VKYIELFGGIGGFSYGIKKAANDNSQTGGCGQEQDLLERGGRSVSSKPNKRQHPICVGYYEHDKYAVQTYNKNFGTDWKPADIRKVSAESVPDHDILCAGFPCQSFSIAGKREGFVDTRGTLFFEICRIAQVKRPKILFLENVKGLLNHDEGKTFTTILLSLYELGYFVEWQVLNSKHYGVPQNRERVFIIGHLGGEPRQKVFPIGEGNTETQIYGGQITNSSEREFGWQQRSPALAARDYKEPKIVQMNDPTFSSNRLYDKDGLAPTLRSQMSDDTKIITHNLQPRSEFRPSLLKDKNAGGHGHLQKDDGSTYALDSGNTQAVEIGIWRTDSGNTQAIRRLTPTECERLQGFPDGWTEGVSDTQRYKQLGNAVTTNVIEAITNKLLRQNEIPMFQMQE